MFYCFKTSDAVEYNVKSLLYCFNFCRTSVTHITYYTIVIVYLHNINKYLCILQLGGWKCLVYLHDINKQLYNSVGWLICLVCIHDMNKDLCILWLGGWKYLIKLEKRRNVFWILILLSGKWLAAHRWFTHQ